MLYYSQKEEDNLPKKITYMGAMYGSGEKRRSAIIRKGSESESLLDKVT